MIGEGENGGDGGFVKERSHLSHERLEQTNIDVTARIIRFIVSTERITAFE